MTRDRLMRTGAAHSDDDLAVNNVDSTHIIARSVSCESGHSRCGPVCRSDTIIRISFNYRRFGTRRHVEAFGYLRANGIGLVSRDGQ